MTTKKRKRKKPGLCKVCAEDDAVCNDCCMPCYSGVQRASKKGDGWRDHRRGKLALWNLRLDAVDSKLIVINHKE